MGGRFTHWGAPASGGLSPCLAAHHLDTPCPRTTLASPGDALATPRPAGPPTQGFGDSQREGPAGATAEFGGLAPGDSQRSASCPSPHAEWTERMGSAEGRAAPPARPPWVKCRSTVGPSASPTEGQWQPPQRAALCQPVPLSTWQMVLLGFPGEHTCPLGMQGPGLDGQGARARPLQREVAEPPWPQPGPSAPSDT